MKLRAWRARLDTISHGTTDKQKTIKRAPQLYLEARSKTGRITQALNTKAIGRRSTDSRWLFGKNNIGHHKAPCMPDEADSISRLTWRHHIGLTWRHHIGLMWRHHIGLTWRHHIGLTWRHHIGLTWRHHIGTLRVRRSPAPGSLGSRCTGSGSCSCRC